jgi:hypothetical protein
MGTSVCTYHIRNCTQEKCIQALKHVRSPQGFVSAVTNNWLTVVDEDTEHFHLQTLEERVEKVSKYLATDVLITAVYDDEVSLYAAFHAGSEIDRYSSSPGVFDWLGNKAFPGGPAKLSKAFAWWQGQQQLEKALKGKFRMESSRLKEISRAFEIPEYRALTKMNDLDPPPSPAHLAAFPSDSKLGIQIRDLQNYVQFK